MPTSVAIIGGAATGCQLASILEDFGCQVYLLEFAQRLIPREDEAISLALADAFGKQRMIVITGAQTERLEKVDGGIQLHYRHQERSASLIVKALLQGRQETRFLVVLLSGQNDGEAGIVPEDGSAERNAGKEHGDTHEDGHKPLIVEPTDTSLNED